MAYNYFNNLLLVTTMSVKCLCDISSPCCSGEHHLCLNDNNGALCILDSVVNGTIDAWFFDLLNITRKSNMMLKVIHRLAQQIIVASIDDTIIMTKVQCMIAQSTATVDILATLPQHLVYDYLVMVLASKINELCNKALLNDKCKIAASLYSHTLPSTSHTLDITGTGRYVFFDDRFDCALNELRQILNKTRIKDVNSAQSMFAKLVMHSHQDKDTSVITPPLLLIGMKHTRDGTYRITGLYKRTRRHHTVTKLIEGFYLNELLIIEQANVKTLLDLLPMGNYVSLLDVTLKYCSFVFIEDMLILMDQQQQQLHVEDRHCSPVESTFPDQARNGGYDYLSVAVPVAMCRPLSGCNITPNPIAFFINLGMYASYFGSPSCSITQPLQVFKVSIVPYFYPINLNN